MVETSMPRSGRGRLLGLRVLIAEDSWLIADTLSVLLEEEGARVVGPSASSEGALQLLEEEDANFALVDMSLSDTFADRIIEKLVDRSIPFAIITGYGALPTNVDAPAVRVFRKPVDRKLLIDLLSGYAPRSP